MSPPTCLPSFIQIHPLLLGASRALPPLPRSFPIFFAEDRGNSLASPRLGSFLGDFPAVVFRRTARANGEREKVEIWQGDAPCHVPTPYQVSSQSANSFHRLPGPYLLSTGFSRGRPRNPSISPLRLGDFPAVFFQWTARANGEREEAAVQDPDPAAYELQLHKVSLQSVHFFYKLPLLYLFPPGFPIFFTEHRGTHRPQSPRPFPRSFSHGRHGQTEKGRRRQFSIQTPHVMFFRST